MANQGKRTALSSVTHVLTTELNSIATGKVCAVSGAFDNAAGKHIYAFFDLLLASLSPAAGAYIEIYGWLSLDATNYGGLIPSTGSDPSKSTPALLITAGLDTTASGTPRIITQGFVLAPGLWKFQVANWAGVTLAASGNTLDLYTADLDLNG
jgi:hypothetical protein